MNLFDKLVNEALRNQPHLSPLRVVVEKELLHHDILRVMRDNNLSKGLTFIGGTCLRACYGGTRLSEDLDFTGGLGFSRDDFSNMGKILEHNLEEKYGLHISVGEPTKDHTNVETWKIKIQTRPESKNLPTQRINIDICALPSYDKRPMLLLNPYGVDMGTSGLIIQSQSREEIYTDKLIAFALRPNRIKYRDVWDILWLHGQGIKPNLELIPLKLKDRNYEGDAFKILFHDRFEWIKNKDEAFDEFNTEMRRFLSLEQINTVLNQSNLWDVIIGLMEDFLRQIKTTV